MPRLVELPLPAADLLHQGDGVARVDDLVAAGLARRTINHRAAVAGWQRLLPGVVLASTAPPTPRQLVVAAWLWGGPGSAIDGATACRWYGIPASSTPPPVHLVVPLASAARSNPMVKVRRTIAEITVGDRGLVPYVDKATAVIVAARGLRSEGDAIELLSRALQTGHVTVSDLTGARERIGDKWCRRVDGALVAVGVGVRSTPEREHRDLLLSSRLLPPPLFNQWIDLADGGFALCPDALIIDAGLALDVEGKRWHAWGQSFETMHRRHERMTAAGLIVLHPTPVRIRRAGGEYLARVEQTYLKYAGRGMPPGVRLVDPPAIAA